MSMSSRTQIVVESDYASMILVEIESEHAEALRLRLTALGASWESSPADLMLPDTVRARTSAREALVCCVMDAIRRGHSLMPEKGVDYLTAVGQVIGHRGDRRELADRFLRGIYVHGIYKIEGPDGWRA